jgi:hypothetical protein
MRETTWHAASKGRIEEIASAVLGPGYGAAIEFSVAAPSPSNIRVYAKQAEYRRYLKKNFPSPVMDAPWLTFYYCTEGAQVFAACGHDPRAENTPSMGLYDWETGTGIIYGPSEYGLVKSTAVGLHTRLVFEQGWNPIHGAVAQVDGSGVLIIGHHGAGKSTALLNVIRFARGRFQVRVLTDDWAVARKKEGDLSIQAIEPRMAVSSQLVAENPHLDLAPQYFAAKDEAIDKAWIHVDDVWPGQHCESAVIRKIFVFSHAMPGTVQPADRAHVAEIIVESAYHMPDEDTKIVGKMREFWASSLSSVSCWEINNRHDGRSIEEIYYPILNLLTGT